MTAAGPGERLRFLKSFLASPRQVGAVLPTSDRAVRSMLDLADLPRAHRVVEMGAGTGPHTREILQRVGPEARVLAYEIDATLAAGLERDLPDPRLEVHAESAERAGADLDGEKADVVVSALPFTSLPSDVRHNLLDTARQILADDGTMLVLQYSPFIQGELEKRFARVQRRFVPLNVPPAFLYAARPQEAP